jgi:acetoin utilization protein AcuB
MGKDYDKDVSFQKLFTLAKIDEVMTTDVVVIFHDDEFSLAEEKFIENNIFYLMVINRSHKLIGLISQKYLYKTHSPKKIMNQDMLGNEEVLVDGDTFYKKEVLDGYLLDQIMKKDPITLRPDNTIAEAILTMKHKNLGCIPIVNSKNEVLGALTHQEIINFSAQLLE